MTSFCGGGAAKKRMRQRTLDHTTATANFVASGA